MNNIRKKDGDSEGDSGFVTPDSTTREKVNRFCEGEDVLSHGKDGIYYLGTIVLVDIEKDRCLIQFEDQTGHWSLFKDITKLRIPESDELCVICKSSKSTSLNEIVLCHICDQGYHQKCLQPKISDEFCEEDSIWECPKCICKTSLQKEDRKKSKETSSPRKQRSRQAHAEQEYKISLPYDLNSLKWDLGHKTNKEQTYCYCGGPGEWYNRMIQCQRCKQWFHEACVDCLHIPLLYGDRFYVFVCSLCNSGDEFLQRLSVKWVDVVHIAAFNLTLQESRMYFEAETGITQWINDNWELLQCPLALQSVGVSERKHEISRALSTHSVRFKCGRECRKKSTVWGLRVRVAPPVPAIKLPSKEIINEQSIHRISLKQKNGQSPPISRSLKLREDKMSESEELLSRFSPAKKRASSPPPISPPHLPTTSPSLPVTSPDEEGEEEIPLVLREEEEKSRIRKKRKREVDILMEDKKAKKMIEDICLNGVMQSSRLCTQAPPSLAPLGVDLEEDVVVKRKRGRPPKNPHLKRSRSGKLLRELHHRRSHNLARDTYKEMKDEEQKDLGGETSGDDTSSHGTLDSFIPPPSNFEGSNHPFLNLDSAAYTMPVIRPLNRKLSENDIKIGKNGEIKRRRFRRKLDKKYLFSSNLHHLLSSNPATQLLSANPTANIGGNIRNCVDYALNGRLLQQSVADTDSALSPQDDSCPQYSLSDLKSSVNSYFGAVNRIANGEKFHILAKRKNYENRVQFLIEWGDSPANT